jgi:hypothetical protein
LLRSAFMRPLGHHHSGALLSLGLRIAYRFPLQVESARSAQLRAASRRRRTQAARNTAGKVIAEEDGHLYRQVFNRDTQRATMSSLPICALIMHLRPCVLLCL